MIRVLGYRIHQDYEREPQSVYSAGTDRVGMTRSQIVSVIEVQLHCIGENPEAVLEDLRRRYEGDGSMTIRFQRTVAEDDRKRRELEAISKMMAANVVVQVPPELKAKLELDIKPEPPKPAKPKTPWSRELDIEKEPEKR